MSDIAGAPNKPFDPEEFRRPAHRPLAAPYRSSGVGTDGTGAVSPRQSGAAGSGSLDARGSAPEGPDLTSMAAILSHMDKECSNLMAQANGINASVDLLAGAVGVEQRPFSAQMPLGGQLVDLANVCGQMHHLRCALTMLNMRLASAVASPSQKNG